MDLKSQAQKFQIRTNDFHSQKPFEIRTKKFGFGMVGTIAIAKSLPFENWTISNLNFKKSWVQAVSFGRIMQLLKEFTKYHNAGQILEWHMKARLKWMPFSDAFQKLDHLTIRLQRGFEFWMVECVRFSNGAWFSNGG